MITLLDPTGRQPSKVQVLPVSIGKPGKRIYEYSGQTQVARFTSLYLYHMEWSVFESTLGGAAPPDDWSEALQSLWYDATEQWDRAHDIAQDIAGPAGAAIHAYLHRKEGDAFNAQYWYHRAGRTVFQGSLQDELKQLVQEF